MADQHDDLLVADLRTLGRTAAPAVDADLLAAGVAASLPVAAPSPWPRITRRRVALAALAALLALLATPPVRATVADWFDFGGVRVGPGESDGDAAPPPPVPGGGDVADAAEAVDFPLLLPTLLGEPEAVAVSDDRRVVSMTWTRDGARVRADQFDGTLDFAVAKQAPRVRFVSVGGRDALWFPRPHEMVLLDAEGLPSGSARLAGHTLVLPGATTTLRLEGDLSLAEAVQIAESATPVG